MSKIEWTNQSWNPATGCTKVSPGCKYCYAEGIANWLQRTKAKGYENGFNLTIHENRLSIPVERKKPTTYFVNSMSDLFHADIPDSFIDQVFSVIRNTQRHTYQILTKRSERLVEYFSRNVAPLNTWLGVSVENRKYGLPRIDHLRQVKANRFLSIEPLLESLGTIDLTGIHWVIVGGESGKHARACKQEWIIEIKDQCDASSIPFFFKQHGGKDKDKGGNTLNGMIQQAIPENRLQAEMMF